MRAGKGDPKIDFLVGLWESARDRRSRFWSAGSPRPEKAIPYSTILRPRRAGEAEPNRCRPVCFTRKSTTDPVGLPLGPIYLVRGVHHHSETRDSGVGVRVPMISTAGLPRLPPSPRRPIGLPEVSLGLAREW